VKDEVRFDLNCHTILLLINQL